MKRVFAAVLAAFLLFNCTTATAASDIDTTARYVLSVSGDLPVTQSERAWAVLSAARSGYEVDATYYAKYLAAAKKRAIADDGIIGDGYVTTNARIILAMTAAGIADARDFYGLNLLKPLTDPDNALKQGINGAVWSLLVLDRFPDDGFDELCNIYLDEILSRQLPDGRFTLTGKPGDTTTNEPPESDITGMVLQALAAYRDREDVADAIDRALVFLSKIQRSDGGFLSRGVANCESASQVVLTLAALGLPQDDERFVKDGNTAYDAMMEFRLDDGSFAHIDNGKTNLMATEQALFAMTAVARYNNSEPGVFEFEFTGITNPVELPDEGAPYAFPPVSVPGVAFPDLSGGKYADVVIFLAERGLVNGFEDGLFHPDDPLTRAQFCALVQRALGLTDAVPSFEDVAEDAWYRGAVGAAEAAGLVDGVGGGMFAPDSHITREQAAVLICRLIKSFGIATALPESAIKDAVNAYGDGATVAEWARGAVAYCFENSILDTDQFELVPQGAIPRGETAFVLRNALAFLANTEV